MRGVWNRCGIFDRGIFDRGIFDRGKLVVMVRV